MTRKALFLSIVSLAAGSILVAAVWPPQVTALPEERPHGAFSFQDSVAVPASPVDAFDAFVDVEAWWDHRFSDSPARFYIDPRPGGGFYEIFDEEGNGVRHAAVIVADRGKILRMDGPLGMSGYALHMVHTLEFEEEDGGTLVRLDVRGAGELEPAWAGVIQGVWHHFLAERFLPYVKGELGGSPTT